VGLAWPGGMERHFKKAVIVYLLDTFEVTKEFPTRSVC
jgi:hypothetical protein